MERVQELALVLVQALDLDVEERVGVESELPGVRRILRKIDLVEPLHGGDTLDESRVVGELLEVHELVEIGDPRRADRLGDERREARVALVKPASGRDAVGLVREFRGGHLREVTEHVALEEIGMERGDAVDGMGADDGKMRHRDLLLRAFFDDRHATDARIVTGEPSHDRAHEASVDLVDDLQVAREEPLEHGDRPAFERLGEQRVVRVAARGHRRLPGAVPGHPLEVDEDAHQLRDRDRGVRVVQLDRVLRRELVEVLVRLLVAPNDVGDRTGDEEVLLLETQIAPRLVVVVRVEDLRDDLARVLVLDRAHVVAVVEDLEVELVARARLPEAQCVHGVVPEACDRGVERDAEDLVRVDPARGEVASLVGDGDDATAELDAHGVLGPHVLPGVAEAQPLVRALDLPPVPDLLLEDAELVADAVAVSGEAEGRHRVEEARGEAPEAAVAETRLRLVLEDIRELETRALQQRLRLVVDAERVEVVGERAPEQELGREVVDPLGVDLRVRLLRLRPAIREPVAHRQREREEAVEVRRVRGPLPERVRQVVEKRALQRRVVHPRSVILDARVRRARVNWRRRCRGMIAPRIRSTHGESLHDRGV